MRRLEDLSLEELWQLFPIEIVAHRCEWAAFAAEEMERLRKLLAEYKPIITHVGSTAIEGLAAKPIVDLLVEVESADDFGEIAGKLAGRECGYICMSSGECRMSFNKGYTLQGYAERVFHLHLRRKGDNDEILFRDYLRAHPETAAEYVMLKRRLALRFRNDRDAYTREKTPFVSRVVALARREKENGRG